jgi:transcription elongation factor Elf1
MKNPLLYCPVCNKALLELHNVENMECVEGECHTCGSEWDVEIRIVKTTITYNATKEKE